MLDAFVCPHCKAYAQQDWTWISPPNSGPNPDTHSAHGRPFHWRSLYRTQCRMCAGFTILDGKNDNIIFPRAVFGPAPNRDLTDVLKHDFDEARLIASDSPRGAAALLRLLVQKLCKELGEKGADLNTDIGNLVKRGVPIEVQKSLDAVRVIGNNAVHPGEIALDDDIQTVEALMKLINLIALRLITEPKQVDHVYALIPESKREAIDRRDGNT